jgi:hypothetical protein
MRTVTGLVIATSLCCSSHVAAATLDKNAADAAFLNCDFNADSALAPGPELDCYRNALTAALQRASTERTAAARQTAPTAIASAEASNGPSLKAESKTRVLLRRSMAAISSFAEPTAYQNAAGAQFAWSDDGVLDNEVWSAQGIAAIAFTKFGEVERYSPYLQSLVVAPYIEFDRTSNSKLTAKDIDNLTYGGLVEGAWSNVFLATQYFRAGGSLVTSFAGEEKNWAITGEWQPVGVYNPYGPNSIFSFLGSPLPRRPGTHYLGFTVSPKLIADYRGELGELATQPLFSMHQDAFRTGPAITFTIDGLQSDDVPWWIRRIHYQITYSWLYDWLSERDYELLDTSLTIALDKLQHVGLTLSYRNGQLFETGEEVDLANIALSFSY